MIREADTKTLMTSSAFAGLFSGIFTNILEVMKTRAMNQALSDEKLVSFKDCQYKVNKFCKCNLCSLRNMFKRGNSKKLFAGIGYNTSMSMVRSSILFPFYEISKIR